MVPPPFFLYYIPQKAGAQQHHISLFAKGKTAGADCTPPPKQSNRLWDIDLFGKDAGLSVGSDAHGFEGAIDDAMKACTKRAEELAAEA